MGKLRVEQRVEPELRLNQRQVWDVASVVLACSLIVAAIASGQSCVTGFLPGFEWRKPFLIDTTLTGAQGYITDFPLQVYLQDASLRHQAFGGKIADEKGYDIAFSRQDGATPMTFSIQSYQPETGEISAIVQLDTLYLGKPTSCFVYFARRTGRGEGEGADIMTISDEKPCPRLYPAHEAKLRNKVAKSFVANGDYIRMGASQRLDPSLQIEYDSFSSTFLPTRRANLIEWQTRYEHQCASFHLERSQNGHSFQVIAFVKGHGFSLDHVPYAVMDPNPPKGPCSYRIRHVNHDGTYSYSAVFPVSRSKKTLPLAESHIPAE